METATAGATAVSALLLVVALVRWRRVRGMGWVALLCASVTVWCWGAWEYELGTLAVQDNAVWLAAVALTCGEAYVFGLRAMGRRGLNNRGLLLLIEPAAVVISGFVAPRWWDRAFNDAHQGGAVGWAFLVHSLYCVGLILTAVGIVLRRYERSAPPLRWFLLGIIASAAAGVALQLTGTDLMPFAAVGVALFVLLAYPQLTADPLTDVDERDVDAVTGVLDRGALDRLVAAAVDRAETVRGRLSLIYVDLDRFKQVNDAYGHLAGDFVLRTVAERIARISTGAGRVARFGGDEFVVVAPDLDETRAQVLAGQIVAVVAAPMTWREETLQVAVSAGVAAYAGGGPAALMEAADRAMYEAKRAGGSAAH